MHKIAFADNADEFAGIVHHWNGADASVHKRFGDLFYRGMGLHRYDRSYHYIPGFHGFLLALTTSPSSPTNSSLIKINAVDGVPAAFAS
jgi:hypothetical protein